MPDARSDPDRSSLLDVTSYQLTLDLTHGGGAVQRTDRGQLPLPAARCHRLCGPLRAEYRASHAERRRTRRGRDGLRWPTPPSRLAADNVLVVEAEFRLCGGPRPGLHYVTEPESRLRVRVRPGLGHRGGRMYCCFDEPDLRAPFTVVGPGSRAMGCLRQRAGAIRPSDGEAGSGGSRPTRLSRPGSLASAQAAGPDQRCSCEQDRGDPLPVTVQAAGSAGARLDHRYLADLLTRAAAVLPAQARRPVSVRNLRLVFGPISPALAYRPPG